MQSVYDKLGDMLHSYLETGKIPETSKDRVKNRSSTADKTQDTDNSVIPAELKEDFILLGLLHSEETYTEPFAPDFSQVRKAYASKLKQIHPDTAKLYAQIAYKNKEITDKLTALQKAFSRIKAWYGHTD